jgi:hypothetical protein
LADLDYAHETLGTYDKVKFFDPDDYVQLAALMKALMDGSIVFDKTEAPKISGLVSRDWKELFTILLCLKETAVHV